MENEIPLISIRDMCKVYNPGENEVWALNHVNLEIGRGELVAIIGQSGSGKSTLMNMLGCLDIPILSERGECGHADGQSAIGYQKPGNRLYFSGI